MSDITPFSFPESRWRHFAKIQNFPGGLLPIADAICRFNPVHGQGMTVAALEAGVLSGVLNGLEGNSLAALGTTFLAKAECIIADPWAMSAIPDFIYPDTTGERPRNVEERLRFEAALARLAVHDEELYKLIVETRHVLKPLALLHDPCIVSRVRKEMADASRERGSLEAVHSN